MRLFKIISVSLAAVTAAGISTAAFAAETEDSGIAATSGEKGVVTYTFTENVTSVGTQTSSDGALVVNIRTTDENTKCKTNFSNEGLNFGRSGITKVDSNNGKIYAPEDMSDYVVYTVPNDGILTGELDDIAWFVNLDKDAGTYDTYGYGNTSKLKCVVKEGDIIQFGARTNESYIKSITFTPDTYDESYTFDIAADALADRTLSVTYDSDTKEKPLSALIDTQTSGGGGALLTGIRFTDIPKDVTISSVVIK